MKLGVSEPVMAKKVITLSRRMIPVIKLLYAPRIEVADAMAVTLEANGIKLSDSFFTVMKDFKPTRSKEEKE